MPSASTPDRLVLDRKAVREIDRAAINDYGIPGIVLMENAARGLCERALTMLADPAGRPRSGAVALIICGSGNNGGDGYALARHLHNARIRVVLAPVGPLSNSQNRTETSPVDLSESKTGGGGEGGVEGDAAVNRQICRRMGITEVATDDLARLGKADLIVDALFGTGLDRPVAGPAASIIQWINSTGWPVLAVDVPSGLDCDTGRPLGACVRASATVTFVALKPGFLLPHSREWTGPIDVVDIGVPRELIERLAAKCPKYKEG